MTYIQVSTLQLWASLQSVVVHYTVKPFKMFHLGLRYWRFFFFSILFSFSIIDEIILKTFICHFPLLCKVNFPPLHLHGFLFTHGWPLHNQTGEQQTVCNRVLLQLTTFYWLYWKDRFLFSLGHHHLNNTAE